MNARTADDARRTVIANQQRGVLARCLDRLKAAVATKDEASIEQEIAAVEAATALTEQTAPGAGGPQIHLHLGDEFPPKKDDDDETEEEKKKRLEKEKAGDEGEQPNPLEARVGALEAGMSEIKELLTKLVPKEDESQAEQEQLAATLAAEAPPGTTDSAIKASTKDSAILQHSFRETVALAEILAPGLAVPTFDRALPPAKTFDSICRHRRAALSLAYQQPAMHKFIADAMPKGKTFDNMSCDETRHVFKSAAAVKAAINNAGNGKVTDVKIIGAAAKTHSPINSLADLNRVAKEKYKTVN